VLFAVLVMLIELLNIGHKHIVIHVSVLLDFILQWVQLVQKELEGKVLIIAHSLIRQGLNNFFNLFEVLAAFIATDETDDWVQEIFNADGVIFIRIHIEEFVFPHIHMKFLLEVPDILEGNSLLSLKQNLDNLISAGI
jgi:hypothetical protein